MNDDRTMGRDELAERPSEERSQPSIVVAGRSPIAVDDVVTIGRHPEGTGILVAIDDDPLISKAHVRIEAADGVFTVTDLGSSNGTSMRSTAGSVPLPPQAPTPVAAGTDLEVGDTIVRLLAGVTEAAPEPSGLISSVPTADDAPGGEQLPPPDAYLSTPQEAPLAPPADSGPTPVPGEGNVLPAVGTGDDWLASAGGAAPPPGAPTSTQQTPAPARTATTSPPADLTTTYPAQDAPAVCASCGRPLTPGSRFCDGCGAAVAPAPHAASQSEAEATGAISVAGREGRNARRRLLIGAVAVLVLVVGYFAATALFDDGDGGGSGTAAFELDVAPDEPTEQWSEDLDGFDIVVGANDDAVVSLRHDDGELLVVALERSDGSELWSADFDDPDFESSLELVTDDVVLIRVCDFSSDDGCRTYGLDAESGDELWDDEIDGSLQLTAGGVVLRDGGRASIFDPMTGDEGARVRADRLVFQGDVILAIDEDEVEVVSADMMDTVFGPVDVDEEWSSFGYDGGELLAVDGDDLLFINGGSETVAEARLPVDEVFDMDVVGPGLLTVGDGEEVFVMELDGDDSEELWSADGNSGLPIDTDAGVILPLFDDGSIVFYDIDTGEEHFDIDDEEGSLLRFGSNLLLEGLVDDETWEAAALDWEDGAEVWELDVEGWPYLVDGAIVGATADGVVFYG